MSAFDKQINHGLHDLEGVDNSGTRVNLSDIVGKTKGYVFQKIKFNKKF